MTKERGRGWTRCASLVGTWTKSGRGRRAGLWRRRGGRRSRQRPGLWLATTATSDGHRRRLSEVVCVHLEPASAKRLDQFESPRGVLVGWSVDDALIVARYLHCFVI